jgi:hypothetical protein
VPLDVAPEKPLKGAWLCAKRERGNGKEAELFAVVTIAFKNQCCGWLSAPPRSGTLSSCAVAGEVSIDPILLRSLFICPFCPPSAAVIAWVSIVPNPKFQKALRRGKSLRVKLFGKLLTQRRGGLWLMALVWFFGR